MNNIPELIASLNYILRHTRPGALSPASRLELEKALHELRLSRIPSTKAAAPKSSGGAV